LLFQGITPNVVGMHTDVEPFVKSGRITPDVGERLSQIAPGSFCFHKSWGAGKVASWDIIGGKVVIDFEKSEGQEMGLKLALQKTEPLAEDDFRAQKVGSSEEMKALAKEDPVELVMRTLRSHGGSMKLDALDAEICGTLVEEADYKKWWEGAKKALRESKKAIVPTKRTDPMVLRDENMSPVDSLVADLEEAFDLKQKARIVEELKGEAKNLAKETVDDLCKSVTESASKSLKLKLGAALDLLGARDELIEAVDKELLVSQSLRISDALAATDADLITEIGALPAARQRRIYESFVDAFGDDWLNKALNMFDTNGARGVSEIAKLLIEKGKESEFMNHLKKSLSHHKLGADALAWICRERKKSASEVFSGQVGTAILSILEQDSMDDGPRKTGRLANLLSSDKDLIGDMVKDGDDNEVKLFSRKLLQSPAFPELDRKSLMARVIKARPEAQDLLTAEPTGPKVEALIVSWESLEVKKAELKDLVEVRIPDNVKEIAVARSYGDLKENFEYKAAKEQQAVLNRRLGEVENELSLAEGTDFVGASTDEVNIGTVVHLTGQDASKLTYTILGAWDSDPDKKILSYLSEAGQNLLDLEPGDTAELRDFETDQMAKYVVDSIEAYKKA